MAGPPMPLGCSAPHTDSGSRTTLRQVWMQGRLLKFRASPRDQCRTGVLLRLSGCMHACTKDGGGGRGASKTNRVAKRRADRCVLRNAGRSARLRQLLLDLSESDSLPEPTAGSAQLCCPTTLPCSFSPQPFEFCKSFITPDQQAGRDCRCICSPDWPRLTAAAAPPRVKPTIPFPSLRQDPAKVALSVLDTAGSQCQRCCCGLGALAAAILQRRPPTHSGRSRAAAAEAALERRS